MTKSQFSRKIAHLYQKKEYRPVGVIILYNQKKQFLLFQSAKEKKVWNFPQGGIRKRESLQAGLNRELREEAGIESDEIQIMALNFFSSSLDYSPNRTNRRGFSRGKFYFYSLAYYESRNRLKLNLKEVPAAHWVKEAKIAPYLKHLSPGKRELTQKALSQALRMIKTIPANQRKSTC